MKQLIFLLPVFFLLTRCNNSHTDAAEKQKADSMEKMETKVVERGDSLPPPYATKSANKRSKVIGWKKDQMPIAPEGFIVTRFAEDLDHPRWIYTAPNGDVFISQANKDNSANNILLFRDGDNDGNYETKTVFLKDLNRCRRGALHEIVGALCGVGHAFKGVGDLRGALVGHPFRALGHGVPPLDIHTCIVLLWHWPEPMSRHGSLFWALSARKRV